FFVPAVAAFTLLFFVVLVLLLLGVGAQGFRQPLQVGVVAFILAALGGSIWVSLRLARSEDQFRYQGFTAEETRGGKLVLFGSTAAASVLLGLALVLYLGKNVGGLGSGAWIDVFALGLLLGLGPYGFYVHRRGQRIRNLEARFPEFLRDLAASHKSGLTLNASVAISARGEYGELTPEIRKMADQLSWNLSFEEALRLLAERVQTPLVQRTASLIIQAGKSGGNTTDVLLAAASRSSSESWPCCTSRSCPRSCGRASSRAPPGPRARRSSRSSTSKSTAGSTSSRRSSKASATASSRASCRRAGPSRACGTASCSCSRLTSRSVGCSRTPSVAGTRPSR
ncbi:MAG: type II secretion system F family protein, partial [Euryarchaeota archaeon]|nr:type II secretion system F family protein [Euryarchaeota archaeon]